MKEFSTIKKLFDQAYCSHRRKDGNGDLFIENENGTITCSKCGITFKPYDIPKSDIADLTKQIDQTLDLIKSFRFELPEESEDSEGLIELQVELELFKSNLSNLQAKVIKAESTRYGSPAVFGISPQFQMMESLNKIISKNDSKDSKAGYNLTGNFLDPNNYKYTHSED